MSRLLNEDGTSVFYEFIVVDEPAVVPNCSAEGSPDGSGEPPEGVCSW